MNNNSLLFQNEMQRNRDDAVLPSSEPTADFHSVNIKIIKLYEIIDFSSLLLGISKRF